MSDQIKDQPMDLITNADSSKGKIIFNDYSQNFYIDSIHNGDIKANKPKGILGKLHSIANVSNSVKTLIAASPILLPIASKIAKKISVDRKEALKLNSQTKQYYLENINQKGYYMIYYNNPEGSTPLTNYIRTFKENIELDDEFEFKEGNEFTEFFSKFIKKKTNKVEYSESITHQNNKFKIVYHFVLENKIFKIKVVSLNYSKNSKDETDSINKSEYSSDKIEYSK